MTLTEALNLKIADLLRDRNWTQQDLADHLDLKQASVSYLISGKRRRNILVFYERLAALFDKPLSALFAELEARIWASEQGVAAVVEKRAQLEARQREILEELRNLLVDSVEASKAASKLLHGATTTTSPAVIEPTGGSPHAVLAYLGAGANFPPDQARHLFEQYSHVLRETFRYVRAHELAHHHALRPVGDDPATIAAPAGSKVATPRRTVAKGHRPSSGAPAEQSARRRRSARKHRKTA